RTVPSYTINEFALPTPNSLPSNTQWGPDGNLWFIEQSHFNLAKMTRAGQVTELPPLASGSPIAYFVFGRDGNLWVGCQTDIAEITPQGAVLHDYTIPSAVPPGPIVSYIPITIGPDGNIWYTEPYRNNLIGRLTPDGQITEFPVSAEF